MQKTSRNSLIERLLFANRYKSPYLQVLDEGNFFREFNDILGDSCDILGERWYNYTVWRVTVFAR